MVALARRLLAHRVVPWCAFALALLVGAPALGLGFFADDLTHQVSFRPEFRFPGGMLGDWDMFRFAGPSRVYLRHLMDIGIFPWWTAPNLRLAFFRPLSALSHTFDYRVMSAWPGFMHAESLLLYGAIAYAVALLYRRLLGPVPGSPGGAPAHVEAAPPAAAASPASPAWVAGLAAVLYAVDDAHALPVTWIANRNALYAVLFGVLAVLAYVASRDAAAAETKPSGRARSLAVLASLAYVVGLCGGETALATLAYLGAHAVFLDRAPWRARARALLPFAAVTAAWLVLYKLLGYGTEGSGYYLDPGSEPLAYGRALLTRLPVLVLAQMALPPSDFWLNVPEHLQPALGAVAAAIVVALGAAFARVLGRDRRAGFFAAAMGLSLVPMCATWPNDRLLLFPGVGGFGLVALFVERAWAAGAGRAARALGVALLAIHAVLAPVLFPLRAVSMGGMVKAYVERAFLSLPVVGMNGTLVVLNAPDMLVTSYAGCRALLAGAVQPRHVRLLAAAHDGDGGSVRREGDRVLVVTLPQGFLDDPVSELVRRRDIAFRPGDVVSVEGMQAEIREVTASGHAKSVAFRFDEPLESLTWVTWRGDRFVPYSPPPAGETVALPPIDYMKAVSGSS